MKYMLIVLVLNIFNSSSNVLRNCNYTQLGDGNNGTLKCPSFSQHICPTKCDPSCKRPLIKRSMCRQPITCMNKACVCGPDYVKDNHYKCILRERCSESCPSDEIYKLCPPSCEIHCGNVLSPPKECPEDEREEHECIAGCVCPSSLIRDYSTGKCVKKEMCSKKSLITCPPDEEYRNCSTTCDKVCNKVSKVCDPTDNDCKKGCFCKNGFIRQNINAKCIEEDHCFTILKDTDPIDEQKNV